MVAPDTARQGNTVTLTGANWQPHTKVTLAIHPTNQANGAEGISLGVTTADERGRLNFVSIVPSAATPGIWSIAARGDANAPSQSASTSLTVLATDATAVSAMPSALATDTAEPPATAAPTATPAATATAAPTVTPPPPTGTPPPETGVPSVQTQPTLQGNVQNGKLTLQGDGWSPGQIIRVRSSKDQSGKDVTWLGQTTADANGHFEFSAKLSKQVRDNAFIIVADDAHRLVARIIKGDGNGGGGD